MSVGAIKECNKFVSIISGPPPMHMVMEAYQLLPDKMAEGTAGFRPPIKQFVTLADEETAVIDTEAKAKLKLL